MHHKGMLEKKQHKVIIFGDSRTKGCATGVEHLLNNDFEVFRFVRIRNEILKGHCYSEITTVNKERCSGAMGGALMTLQEITS